MKNNDYLKEKVKNFDPNNVESVEDALSCVLPLLL